MPAMKFSGMKTTETYLARKMGTEPPRGGQITPEGLMRTESEKPWLSGSKRISVPTGKNRLGGSALAQVYNQLGSNTHDFQSTDIK